LALSGRLSSARQLGFAATKHSANLLYLFFNPFSLELEPFERSVQKGCTL
jgi:hypothetical protein